MSHPSEPDNGEGWTETETETLIQKVLEDVDNKEREWTQIASETTKTPEQCERWWEFLIGIESVLMDNGLIPQLKKRSKSDADEQAKKRQRRLATQIDRKYKCPIPDCPRAYGTEGALKFHYKNKHKGDLEQSYSPLASDEAAAGGVGAGLGSLGVFPGPFEGLAASGIFQVPPDMFPPGTFQNPVALFPINGPVFKSIIPPLVFDPNFSQPKENAAGGSPKEENEAEGESDNVPYHSVLSHSENLNVARASSSPQAVHTAAPKVEAAKDPEAKEPELLVPFSAVPLLISRTMPISPPLTHFHSQFREEQGGYVVQGEEEANSELVSETDLNRTKDGAAQ